MERYNLLNIKSMFSLLIKSDMIMFAVRFQIIIILARPL